MFGASGITAFLILLVPYIESANRLNEYISHYEPAEYDHRDLHAAHSRAKRSVTQNHVVHLALSALGRSLNIRLKRDLSTFGDQLRVVDHTGTDIPAVSTAHIYQGHLLGEPDSTVFGSIHEGIFEGKIVSKLGNLYIEKASRYFPPDANISFHSVVYKEADVDDPYKHLRTGHVSGCGITDSVSQWMEQIQSSATEEEGEPDSDKANNKLPKKYKGSDKAAADSSEKRWQPLNVDENETPFDKYSEEANTRGMRRKRATRPKEENKNTCSLFIETDPLIWRHVSEQVGFDPAKTREEILSLIAHHVTAVNYIYRDTKFDGRVEHRNIKFEVQRIKIDDDSPCKPGYQGEKNHFCMENIDVSNFLNLHSLGNHEDFCLAYVFTYRDFTGGTLGLAWVASASGASGGICEKYKTYTETVGGIYQSTKRSLNTGIITFVNYNSRVPPKVSQLTLAHEIGHNFGSPHDYPSECRPGGLSGNFIMFASATSGDRPNNSKFSSCSVGNISNVLDAIEDKKKRNCFEVSEGAFCGNKIVEAGEECDCGYDDDECTDKCCYPRVVSERDSIDNVSAKGCQRRANTQCSPSQGPCCNSNTCKFVSARPEVRCKEVSDCSWSSNCDGRSAQCPPPNPKANMTFCNENSQLCIAGECTGSLCLQWGMQECFLSSNLIPNIDKRKLCELACQNGTDPDSCRSTSEFGHKFNLSVGGLSLRPGSPCDNFQGYCDVFFKCRAVDAEGPLARLKNMLFNEKTLNTVALWVQEYWWACMLMGILFIIFMGIFIKCCAVHTPSSNPKKPPARRFSETLRRPITTLRRMRHHHHHNNQQGGHGAGSGRGGGASAQRPGHSRGPAHGYGEGRGQYYAPKASAPPRPELYAGAYTDRNAFPMRQHKV